jgi:phosphoserine phosphatase RsbU/P
MQDAGPSRAAARRLYAILALVFVITMASQIPFTVDVCRVLARDYPWRTFYVGAPWPSVAVVGREGIRAGIQKGDQVVSIDGVAPSGYGASARPFRQKHPGDFITLRVRRGGQEFDIRQQLIALPMWRPFAAVCMLGMPWLSLVLGFWVAAARVRDYRSWLLLGLLLGFSQVVQTGNVDPRGWPQPMAVFGVVFRGFALRIWAICMMLFGIYFPQRWRAFDRVQWVKWALIVPLAALCLWDTLGSAVAVVNYRFSARWFPMLVPEWVQIALVCLAIGLFFVALANKYRDPELRPDARRRLKLIYWGCAAALSPLFCLIVVSLVVYGRQPGDGLVIVSAYMALALFPITLAYAIVVQRALDVRVVVRQGLQYALARGGVKVIQVALIFGVIALAVSFTSTGMSLAKRITSVAFGIALAMRVRDLGERLRRWVDRRFFREAYDAERILGELGEQVRSILEKDTLLGTVAGRLSESLHVERVVVALREGPVFRAALALGYPAPLHLAMAGDAAAFNGMLASGKPLIVERDTPDGALAGLGAEVVLPLAAKNELIGFITLGPKKSEEPYTSSDARLLGAVASQAGLAIENSRLSETIAAEVAHREMLHREIEIASEVQQRLFPQNMPEVRSLSYAGHCRPARGVGGDYYDFLALPSGRFGLAIADICGKGIPAALLMASLQASVRGQSMASGNDVAGLMENVNRLVYDASPANRYATFFYSQFDPATRILTYSNGGHNPPILLRGAETLLLETGGPVVGLFRPARYEQAEIQLHSGDLLLLYTDGVSEAENPAQEEWGEAALIDTARALDGRPPNEMIASLMAAADNFANGAPQHDDMTLVIARVGAE